MLQRANRLAKESDFRQIMSKGKTLQGKFFTIKYLDREPELPSRIGIVTSKKIAKQAVRRNKARRRIREAIRQDIKDIPGKDIVFLVKREILEAKYTEIADDAKNALQKLRP